MATWIRCPPFLRWRLAGTLFVGIGSISIALVVFILSGDGILLALSCLILSGCLLRCGSLWHTIRCEDYETVTGICTGINSAPFRKYRKIYILGEDGSETALLLEKQQRIKLGGTYRFYFKKDAPASVGSDYLDAMLAASQFLGCEEIG